VRAFFIDRRKATRGKPGSKKRASVLDAHSAPQRGEDRPKPIRINPLGESFYRRIQSHIFKTPAENAPFLQRRSNRHTPVCGFHQRSGRTALIQCRDRMMAEFWTQPCLMRQSSSDLPNRADRCSEFEYEVKTHGAAPAQFQF